MDNGLKIKLYSVTVDCRQPLALAEFYAALLGWAVVYTGEEYTVIGAPGAAQGTYPGITFQRNTAYAPPVWPARPGEQQAMEHMDIAVNDLEKAVAHATQCGATVAETQFTEDWTVLLDPEGHPFCLVPFPHIFAAEV